MLATDELHVDTHMSSLVQDLLSPLTNDLTPRSGSATAVATAAGIDSLLDSPPVTTLLSAEQSPRAGGRSKGGSTPGCSKKKEGGSRILHMLQNAAAHAASNTSQGV